MFSDPLGVACPTTPGQRRLSTGPDGQVEAGSGAVSGRSTLHSGLFRRRTPLSEDLCLFLSLAAAARLERVAPASTGPGMEFDVGRTRVMAGKADQMKGKAKEAVGDLTGNKDLKSEGKADRQAGEAKEKVEEVIDKAKDVLHPKK